VGGIAGLSNGGTFFNASSRSYKENFGAVNGLDVLSRLVKLPIMTWDYKGSSEGLHMGPVAEDFKASFGLAGDGKSISTVDADGIALAAIQGLNVKLETENALLRARLDALEAQAK
jgi:trimeric autotransporter adhesin